MKKVDCIFIVKGKEIKEGFSNVTSINTYVIPNIGEEIFYGGELHTVKRKVINYKMVEKYDLKDSGRGKEMIYIFI